MTTWRTPATLPAGLTLAAAPLRRAHRVVAVVPPAHAPEWAPALDALGFVPGEDVQLLARARPGNDPLVVRVGTSTYALRGAEAACIVVAPR